MGDQLEVGLPRIADQHESILAPGQGHSPSEHKTADLGQRFLAHTAQTQQGFQCFGVQARLLDNPVFGRHGIVQQS